MKLKQPLQMIISVSIAPMMMDLVTVEAYLTLLTMEHSVLVIIQLEVHIINLKEYTEINQEDARQSTRQNHFLLQATEEKQNQIIGPSFEYSNKINLLSR